MEIEEIFDLTSLERVVVKYNENVSSSFWSPAWMLYISESSLFFDKHTSYITKLKGFIFLCFIHYGKVFKCVDCIKQWKVLRKMGTLEHLIISMINFYIGHIDRTWWNRVVPSWQSIDTRFYIFPYLSNIFDEYMLREQDWKKMNMVSCTSLIMPW